MNNSEFYDTLGVSKDASQDDIKKAYRKLSKKYHPDINHEEGAEEKYKAVQEAYETLGDEQKRQMYDQYGKAGADGGFGGGQGFGGFGGFGGGQGAQFSGDLNDLFEQMFGGGFSSDPNRPRQGRDLQYRMNLTFEEAIFGKETTINYTRQGENSEQERKELKVTIPAGVEDGQQMRLEGQGEAGTNGGPYGDLYVVFYVSASKDGFDRDGGTIYSRVAIDYPTAVLGGEISVKTVHGDVSLKIPAGTQTETNFRLRGKGAPLMRGNNNGDHIVTVFIDVPKKLNKDQKKALTNYQETLDGQEAKRGLFGK
ncbi:DnaJ C-terminal domain-containing protein [Weissella viridescens]|uniref:DnaJ C-terminal domain-containing protein n=1 Tax=Weissella viridescens TaxID=1629 RepID=UPI003AF204F0